MHGKQYDQYHQSQTHSHHIDLIQKEDHNQVNY